MISIISLRVEYHVINIILAILINTIFIYIILISSKHIGNLFCKSGINIITKVFGIVLLAIAVNLFTSNIGQLL